MYDNLCSSAQGLINVLPPPPNYVVNGEGEGGKDIVFRFIIEYSSLRDFAPLGNNNNRSIFI